MKHQPKVGKGNAIIKVGFKYLDGRSIYVVPLTQDAEGHPMPRAPRIGGYTAFYDGQGHCAIAPTPELEFYLKQRSYAFRWGKCKYTPQAKEQGHRSQDIPAIFTPKTEEKEDDHNNTDQD